VAAGVLRTAGTLCPDGVGVPASAVEVGVAVVVIVGLAVAVAVAVDVAVDVGEGVNVGVGEGEGVSVGVSVGVDVGVSVGVAVDVSVGVSVGWAAAPLAETRNSATTRASAPLMAAAVVHIPCARPGTLLTSCQRCA